MLEAKFSKGEELFAVVGIKIQKHICMGSFELNEKISTVITPYGKLSTLDDDKTFKTFEEAKAFLVELGENSVKVADEQLKGINLISESDVEVLPNNTPTEEEMKADEDAIAQKQADKIQEEAKSEDTAEEPIEKEVEEEAEKEA